MMRQMIPAITACSEAARRTDLLEEALLIAVKTLPPEELPQSVVRLRESYESARANECRVYAAHYADSRGAPDVRKRA